MSPETPGTVAEVVMVSPETPGTTAAVLVVPLVFPRYTRDSSSGGDGAPWFH